MKRTKKITLAACFAALSVLALLTGSLFSVLDASAALLASFIMLVAVSELPLSYAALTYAAAAVLALFLLPEKSPAVYFLLFTGYYPLLLRPLNRLPRALSLTVKLLLFNAAMTGIYLVLLFLVGGVDPFKPLVLLFYLPLNAVFLLYDFALKRLSALWFFRLRRRFGGLFR